MAILSSLFVFYTIYLAIAIGLLTLRNGAVKTWSRHDELLLVISGIILTGYFSLTYAFQPLLIVVNIIISVALLALGKYFFKNYSYSGINFYLANLIMTFVGIVWGVDFMSHLTISFMTKILLFSTSPLLILTLPMSIVSMVEKFDIVCREQ